MKLSFISNYSYDFQITSIDNVLKNIFVLVQYVYHVYNWQGPRNAIVARDLKELI